MCSNENICSDRMPVSYELALSNSKLTIMTSDDRIAENMPVPSTAINNNASIMQPLDQYRLHLYNYALQAERLRLVQSYSPISNPICPPALNPYGPRWAFPMSLLQHRLHHDEPKPQHSYIGLIAMAILSSPDTKLVLSDIYQYILDNYPYFRTRGPGWRNSIRHNLSLNDCFIKAGRSANGKGHYWAIHPANIDDFRKGDFRRRKAQRKVRKHMGLVVEDDGNDSPSPPPLTPPPTSAIWSNTPLLFPNFPTNIPKKRQFDVASLLAPDENPAKRKQISYHHVSSSSEDGEDTAVVDVITGSEAIMNNNNDNTENNNRFTEDLATVAENQGPNLNLISGMGPWCYPMGLINSSQPHHHQSQPLDQQQQLMAKAYYEHLSQARTIQIGLYQQWQLQRRSLNADQPAEANEESDKEIQ